MSDDRSHAATILKAVEFASRKHATQRRKGSDASPYVNHVIAVAHLLADVGGIDDLDILVAAILHDTIEDTDTTAAELDAHFGVAVRELVQEVTDDKTLEKAERKRLQIEHAPYLSREAKVIKLGDKIANIRDVVEHPPADWPLERRLDYLDWTEKVIAGCRGANAALEELYDETVEEGRRRLRD